MIAPGSKVWNERTDEDTASGMKPDYSPPCRIRETMPSKMLELFERPWPAEQTAIGVRYIQSTFGDHRRDRGKTAVARFSLEEANDFLLE